MTSSGGGEGNLRETARRALGIDEGPDAGASDDPAQPRTFDSAMRRVYGPVMALRAVTTDAFHARVQQDPAASRESAQVAKLMSSPAFRHLESHIVAAALRETDAVVDDIQTILDDPRVSCVDLGGAKVRGRTVGRKRDLIGGSKEIAQALHMRHPNQTLRSGRVQGLGGLVDVPGRGERTVAVMMHPESAGCVLDRLEVCGSQGEGVFVHGALNVTLRDCEVCGSDRNGLVCTGGSNTRVAGGRIHGSGAHGVWASDVGTRVEMDGVSCSQNRGNGVVSTASATVSLEGGAACDNHKCGVWAFHSGSIASKSCRMEGNEEGQWSSIGGAVVVDGTQVALGRGQGGLEADGNVEP
ncbi:unnamed protein product [Pedinophyceae sp. YPF-701]|nr:unnamed protein product [Pedinophyceae sp. YPF-701]